jgi:hypothetical protein
MTDRHVVNQAPTERADGLTDAPDHGSLLS